MFFAWLLAPDLSMLGYSINNKLGAWTYNVVHHQAFAIMVGILGYYVMMPSIEFTAIILFGHSALDRAFGYGLKYEDSFKHTHLGEIGKS